MHSLYAIVNFVVYHSAKAPYTHVTSLVVIGKYGKNIRLKIDRNAKAYIFFNWSSLQARLNSHYEAWSYKKKSTKKITGYRKFV